VDILTVYNNSVMDIIAVMTIDGSWVDIVKQLGVPTAVMTVVGWWTYKLVGFLKELIKIELKDVKDSVDNLSRKIRELQDDMVRQESLLRHIYDLAPNFNKIAKRNIKDDSDALNDQ
tara:strand:- start:93 stop:443 length:351 start_codon:yes stop_codon:yes gene_type:complete